MSFLYGKCDTKFIKSSEVQSKRKIQPLETYKFKLCPLLEGKWKLPKNEAAIRYRTTPDTLVELCSPIVNALPLPQPQNWTTVEVADWIRKLGFPQYQNAFKRNYVNGRMLLKMDASYLTRINITNFDHIRAITKSIREMFGFERSTFTRSVSLPERDPGVCYKFFRTYTGLVHDTTRRTDFLRMRHMLQPKPSYDTNWQSLERWLMHCRPAEKHLIGGTKGNKYNLYFTMKKQPRPQERRKLKECDGMPPCTSDWTVEKELRQPSRLSCLKKTESTSFQKDVSCKCTTPCVCGWRKGHRKNLSILRMCLPNRYDVHNQKRLRSKKYKIFLGKDKHPAENLMDDIFLNSQACKNFK